MWISREKNVSLERKENKYVFKSSNDGHPSSQL